MTGYLRQIAARGAGVSFSSTTAMTPPRVSSFVTPTPIVPPVRSPLSDEASSPLDSKPAASQSSAEANPNSPASTILTASSEENRHPVLTTRTPAVPSHEVAPPPVDSRSNSISTSAEAKIDPSPSRTRNDSPEIEPSPVRVEPTSVSISPPSSTSISPREDRLGVEAPAALSTNVERPAGLSTNVELPPTNLAMRPPSIEKQERRSVESAEVAASSKAERTPRVVVRLEPAPQAGAFEFQAQPAAAPIDSRYVIETRVLPLLTRERVSHASQPRDEVRVTIGGVEVRLESNTPPTPVINQPAAPGDPFAALALARRGWRMPF